MYYFLESILQCSLNILCGKTYGCKPTTNNTPKIPSAGGKTFSQLNLQSLTNSCLATLNHCYCHELTFRLYKTFFTPMN